MEGIRMIGMSLCVTAAVTALFSMLVPDNRMEKVLRFAVSLFFLTSLVSPFLSGGLDFHMDLSVPDSAQSDPGLAQSVESQFTGLAEKKVASAVEKALAQEGIPVKKVQVSININEDGGISITKMCITVNGEEHPDTGKIAETVKREVGFTPEIEIL